MSGNACIRNKIINAYVQCSSFEAEAAVDNINVAVSVAAAYVRRAWSGSGKPSKSAQTRSQSRSDPLAGVEQRSKSARVKTQAKNLKGSPERPRILKKKLMSRNQKHALRRDFVANAEATSVGGSQECDILPEPACRELSDGTKVN